MSEADRLDAKKAVILDLLNLLKSNGKDTYTSKELEQILLNYAFASSQK